MVHHLDTTSVTDKLRKIFGKSFSGKFKLNADLWKKNIIILYPFRQGVIQILDLSRMNSYCIELPLQIKSLQVVSNEKWLIQNVDNR